MNEPEQILTVTEFTRQVKQLLESGVPPLWIRGEVSNLRLQSSGHCYFSLKDAGSQTMAVIFKGDLSRLGFIPANGMRVIALGKINVYEPRGNYQLIIRTMQEDGIGRLYQEFERLKKRLAEEGLFAAERKKPIPGLPQTIGVITSPTGAAIRDFLSILKRRGWPGRVIVIPVRVQGSQAAPEIAKAIRLAASWTDPGLDLLVVGRGGGSLEDLWPFNEEIVCRAIAECPLPVISTVGHEIDTTLSDFAADKRAETPSAAAELISSGFLELYELYRELAKHLYEVCDYRLERSRSRLDLLVSRLLRHSPHNRLENAFLKLDDIQNRLSVAAGRRLASYIEMLRELGNRHQALNPANEAAKACQQLAYLKKSLVHACSRQLDQKAQKVVYLQQRLASANPNEILKRGYTITRKQDGTVVSSPDSVTNGERLLTETTQGVIESEVTKSSPT